MTRTEFLILQGAKIFDELLKMPLENLEPRYCELLSLEFKAAQVVRRIPDPRVERALLETREEIARLEQ